MGRHSRPGGNPSTTRPGLWSIRPRARVDGDGSDVPADQHDAAPDDAAPDDVAPDHAAPADAAPDVTAPSHDRITTEQRPAGSATNPVHHTPGALFGALDETVRIPHTRATGAELPPVSPAVLSASAGNVLTRPADPTQAFPRIRPDLQPPPVAVSVQPGHVDDDPERARSEQRNHPERAQSEQPNHPEQAPTDDDTAANPRRWRHGRVWAGLVVFWLLALGAGLITLASLGAPHYLCTGSTSTGLACQGTGTVIAAVLTVALIVAVGWVSVLAIEARSNGRTAWRWLGIGVVVLVVVANAGYLLIRTIGS